MLPSDDFLRTDLSVAICLLYNKLRSRQQDSSGKIRREILCNFRRRCAGIFYSDPFGKRIGQIGVHGLARTPFQALQSQSALRPTLIFFAREFFFFGIKPHGTDSSNHRKVQVQLQVYGPSRALPGLGGLYGSSIPCSCP